MARKEYKKEIKTKRMFATGSSYSGDTILTSSFNEMSKSFVNNDYLGPNGLNTSGVGGIVYMMNEMKGDLDDLHSEVSSSVYDSQINSGSYISQIKTFADRDAPPSVEGGSLFVTANGRATNITAFDDPTEGQQITIIIKDTHTDFTNGGISGKGVGRLLLHVNQHLGAATTGDTISFVYNDGIWIETNRSDNT